MAGCRVILTENIERKDIVTRGSSDRDGPNARFRKTS